MSSTHKRSKLRSKKRGGSKTHQSLRRKLLSRNLQASKIRKLHLQQMIKNLTSKSNRSKHMTKSFSKKKINK